MVKDAGCSTVFQQPSLAVAVDLGTTTIASALLDTTSGAELAREGSLNPQRSYGADVVRRLEYACRGGAERRTLSRLVNCELERLVEKLLSIAGMSAAAIRQLAVAANPAMSHLLLDLPVESLAFPPYRPKVTSSHRLSTRSLGWSIDLPLYVFPSPGGFVGGDLIAFLHGLGVRGTGNGQRRSRIEAGEEGSCEGRSPVTSHQSRLFLDLGTNGEMALLAGDRLLATSAAAGPAFEGGNLSCGMAALSGAINRLDVEGGRLSWSTIDNASPLGFCGSGILDAISLMLSEGIIDATGRLRSPDEISTPLGSRVREFAGERHFVVYRDAARMLSITQTDIRQVQLAKGAVRAGIEVLLEKGGVKDTALTELLLTGSFGASLRLESLKSIGVLTGNMVKNARFIGEGALRGVIRHLVTPGSAVEVESLAASLQIIPLSGTPGFERHFMGQMEFHEQA